MIRSGAQWVTAIVVLGACSSSTAGGGSSGNADAGQTVDAGSDAPDLPPGFDCLGSVQWPAAKAAKVTLGVSFVDYAIDGPKDPFTSALSLKACAASDAGCANALATASTDGTGKASLSVSTGPSGFDGYVEATGADRMPLLAFFYPPVAADSDANQNQRGIASKKTMDEIADAVGTTIDPTRGHVVLRARNCTNLGVVEGARFTFSTADGKSVGFGYQGGRPKAGATTDTTGLGGAINLPPGPVTVRASLAASGKFFGSYTLVVRAGTLTSTSAPPTPNP